ncbi:MAG: Imidazolonepropionase [Xanthomonadales bacterium]|nr:Imidazolonepropionase [Xanthomonadales bacterium]
MMSAITRLAGRHEGTEKRPGPRIDCLAQTGHSCSAAWNARFRFRVPSRPRALPNLLASSALALLLTTASPAATLLTGATIHPVSSAPIENGQMLVDGGKIVAVGADLSAQAAGAEHIDYSGKWLLPAFIVANSVMGLTEIESVRGTVDFAEAGAINPNARAQVAINADSELLPVARANGVLYAQVVPQVAQGGIIAGQSALVRLAGWNFEEMTLRSPVGMHLMWPTARLPPFLPPNLREEAARGAQRSRELIERVFDDAAAYATARAAGSTDIDARWEALRGVLDGRIRLFIHALDLQQIREALDFTERRALAFTLVGAQDGWRAAELLAARGIPVILYPPSELPLRRHEGPDAAYANAARLAAAGVEIALGSDGSSFAAALERNLPYAAGMAVAHGLAWEQGLRAITLAPARMLGVADRLGTLEPGKDASFIVSDGDPLDVRSGIVAAWIEGQPVDLSNRHSRLRDRHQPRYRTR